MLRIIQNTSAAGAKSYYTSASMADYYTEGQELEGIWRGEGAARLGLSGAVQKEAWDALCDNRHPATGEALTPRRKSERRVGYDFNFHVPKSVSILYGLTQDEQILKAFRASVDETMRDAELEVKTRVRKGGKNEDRTTGNALWGEFIHTTARPINGIPDPHLHAHCFVFNTTFDEKENRWKAAQIGDLKRDAPYYEAKFHARMSWHLGQLGLRIERTKKGWEIEGIPASAIQKFSRRTALIEKLAEQKGIRDAGEKSELGAKTRERKRKDFTMDELRQEWRSRLSDDERAGIAETAEQIGSEPVSENLRAAEHAASLAVEHCFERKSVVPERTLLAEALKRCGGEATVEAVESAVRDQNIIVGEKEGERFATTRTVLAEETRMIEFARSGRGVCEPLGKGPHVFNRDWLNDGQRRAVEHVLESTDRVIVLRGVAGSGKTTMMCEAVEAVEAGGKKVFAFAPSADASRGVLRESGFKNADTVARALLDEKLQEKIRGQVVWIDEASMIGTRTMGKVFDLADKLDARVILTGDRQHGSVERGAALRLLETEAGLVPAEIKEIKRQRGAYKEAVKALAEGRTELGFQGFDQLGWIKEVADDERYKLLARDYVASVNAGKSALVVSPTHLEGEWVTDEIRAELRRDGKLGVEQRRFRTLHNANLTSAERADSVNYSPGDMLVFHQNAKGIRKGERIVVGEDALPLDVANRYTVFRPDVLSISSGDVLRITHNGKTADGEHRLNNGANFTVKGFTSKGDIRLTNGWTIDKDFGHISHGYSVTSQASQGKTVDRVFIGISSASLPAASREGFYVACSRGREFLRIYSDNKEALLEAINHQSDDRLSATEFVAEREQRERGEALRRMERQRQAERESTPKREREGVAYER
jgi:conjugative relaxase-like TrwC/TraI family protein